MIEIVDKKENEINKAEKQHQEISLFNENFSPAFIENMDTNEKNELKNQINMKIRNINLAISKNQMLKKESENIQNFLNKSKFGNHFVENEENKSKILKPIKINKTINSRNNSKLNDTNKIIKTPINEDKNKSLVNINKINFKMNIPESKKKKKKEIPKYFRFSKINFLSKSSSQPNIIRDKKNSEIFFNDKRFRNCKNEFDIKFKELTTPFGTLLRKNKRSNFLPKITKFNELFNK